MTEREAKALLMERLDDCLKVHADLVDSQNIGSIYDLQELSELHYYLKVEHEFTAAEVEALLQFKDPLDVARWCREDNGHEHSFPICELLNEINAYDRFEQYPSEPSLKEKELALIKLLGQNYFSYMEEIEKLSAPAVIARCSEIATTMTAFRYMTEEYELTREAADYLLRFDNPLELIRSYWPDGVIEGETVMQVLLDDIRTPPEERSYLPKSVREQLQAAKDQVKGHTASERPHRDPTVR